MVYNLQQELSNALSNGTIAEPTCDFPFSVNKMFTAAEQITMSLVMTKCRPIMMHDQATYQ